MLRCFTCFAHWQLPNLWLSHPAAGGLELQEPRKFWSHPDPLDNTDALACRDKTESDIMCLENLLGSAAAAFDGCGMKPSVMASEGPTLSGSSPCQLLLESS